MRDRDAVSILAIWLVCRQELWGNRLCLVSGQEDQAIQFGSRRSRLRVRLTELADHSETGRSEMAIERESHSNPALTHQDECQGIDRRKPVKVSTFEMLQACSRSRGVQGNTRSRGTVFREVFHVRATSRMAL